MDHVSRLLSDYPSFIELLRRATRLAIILLAIAICAKLVTFLSRRILDSLSRGSRDGKGAVERLKRINTLVQLAATSARFVLFGGAILMALREFGFDITPLLTGAGIAGVAVGLGSQTLVRDVLAGIFILIEDQIRVGDVVQVNGTVAGTVEKMQLRVIVLRDGDGALHIVPNGEIKAVSNQTYDYSNAVVELPLPYAVEFERVAPVMKRVCEEFGGDPAWRSMCRSTPELVGITGFGPAHFEIQVTVRTEPHARWVVARELRRRTKLALEAAKIAMPIAKA